jgi:hypothetical protein
MQFAWSTRPEGGAVRVFRYCKPFGRFPRTRIRKEGEKSGEVSVSVDTSKGSFQCPITNLSVFLTHKQLKKMFVRLWNRRNKNETHSDFFFLNLSTLSQSEWLRGLRHELSSPAQTLGSWVRFPLEAWMFVYVYTMFVLAVCGLATGWSPVQGVLLTKYSIKKLKRRPKPNKGM